MTEFIDPFVFVLLIVVGVIALAAYIEKSNIISSHFYQYGIGMARDRDGQIYLCQLFQ